MAARRRPNRIPADFDLAGLILSAAGVSILLYTLTIGPHEGWLSTKTLTFAFVGAACLVALVIIELRIDEPILALRLLRDRSFRTINIASSMTYAGFFGMIFVLPLYLQSLRGYTAFQSGLAQSPQAVGIFLVSNLFGRRLYRTIGPRRLMVVGIALTSVITCCYSLVGPRHAAVGSSPVCRSCAASRSGWCSCRSRPRRTARPRRRHGSGDVAVQHATSDRLRRRHRRGGDGDRRPHPARVTWPRRPNSSARTRPASSSSA